ncbi:MAG: SDR family oxidoreductase [Acidimicrobiales bacterium]
MGTFAVTGSASGIGAATATRLEANNHEVIGVDLRGADIEADLSTPSGRSQALDDIIERCGGRLDGFLASAGVGPPFDPEVMASVNYFGSQVLLEGLRPVLAATGDAQVVAVSSNSTTTQPSVPAELVEAFLAGDEDQARALAATLGDGNTYASSKTALARWVRRHAPQAEWAGSGIRLNAIAPGATMTPLLQSGLDDDDYGPLISGFPVPTGGFGDPDQIAAWIEFMLCDDGARFMCGSIVFVDGGTDALVRPDAWPDTYEF